MSSVETTPTYQHLSDPAEDCISVNLAADTTLAADCRGLLVLTGGTVVLATAANPTVQVTLPNVPVGILPIRVAVVYSMAHGTTASNIFALY